MSRRRYPGWLAAGLIGLSSAVATAQSPPAVSSLPIGTWVNPHGTVKVATNDCGGKLCGWIVWAAAEAVADAKHAGVENLLGTELLRDYHGTAEGHWTGEVYVPDMGRTFFSTIEQIGQDKLRIRGCVLGGLICKSQLWQRG